MYMLIPVLSSGINSRFTSILLLFVMQKNNNTEWCELELIRHAAALKLQNLGARVIAKIARYSDHEVILTKVIMLVSHYAWSIFLIPRQLIAGKDYVRFWVNEMCLLRASTFSTLSQDKNVPVLPYYAMHTYHT